MLEVVFIELFDIFKNKMSELFKYKQVRVFKFVLKEQFEIS